MIKVIPGFLTNNQIEKIINRFSILPSKVIDDNTYNFSGVNLLPYKQDIFNIIPNIKSDRYSVLRLQLINKDIPVADKFHVDEFPFSFIIFLNSLKGEGLLEFENVNIHPLKGTLVTIDGETAHRVTQAYQDRWTLVGFLSEDLFQLRYTSTNKSIL